MRLRDTEGSAVYWHGAMGWDLHEHIVTNYQVLLPSSSLWISWDII